MSSLLKALVEGSGEFEFGDRREMGLEGVGWDSSGIKSQSALILRGI